ncbi:MAG: hypothetical protein ACRDOT_01670 [Aeromicrobium sp.]
MGHGFRSAIRLAVTVATAAAVVGAAASARRMLNQPAPHQPRHRAPRPATDRTRPIRPTTPHLVPAIVLTADLGKATTASPTYHPFGPEPCIVPSHGIEIPSDNPPAEVIELEASGELDGDPSPTERLLARRHAGDEPTPGSARDAPDSARRYG